MAGGPIGFLAGTVGIRGGIFLPPLLYMLRWGPPKAIAGTSAAFILANSISGLGGIRPIQDRSALHSRATAAERPPV